MKLLDAMPQSLTRLFAHLIFSTKERRQWLDSEIRPGVHGYLATNFRDQGSKWVLVGGVSDHVHILFEMSKLVAPVKMVETAKRESSKFIKKLGPRYRKFYWQRGYGMFSVSPRNHDEVEYYIRNQEEHHRNRSFQDEYRSLLKRCGINIVEKNLWD